MVSAPPAGTRAGLHGALAAVSLLVAMFSMRKIIKPRLRTVLFFKIPPAICFCVAYDNIVAALDDDASTGAVNLGHALSAAIVPLCLVLCWEVGYQIHKRRSTNFCCITFDASHRSQHGLATVLRFFVWVVAFCIFVLSVLVNYNVIFESPAADRGGSHCSFAITPSVSPWPPTDTACDALLDSAERSLR